MQQQSGRQHTCPCCRQNQSKYYCQTCIAQGMSTHRDVCTSVAKQASSSNARAQVLLDQGAHGFGAQSWRRLRAEVAIKERECRQLREKIAATEQRLSTRRTSPVKSARCRPTPYPHDRLVKRVDEDIENVQRQQEEITRKLADARRVLVREAVSVFGLKKGATKQGHWEIAGLPLPPPELFRLHRSARINAALGHTIHLLSLVTRYLSVALPFYPVQPTPHVGRPTISANVPLVSTTRFHDEPILWMSSIARADTADKPKSQLKQRRFLTAFGLLAHSVGYLAHTQGTTGVGIPNADRPGDVSIAIWSILELINALATSPRLGEFSHEPGGHSTAPHLLYGLDVAKVVGSILRAEERRWGAHKLDASDLSEGWDLIDSAEE